MIGIQSINVMSIESESKLVYFFESSIAIYHDFDIPKHNDWLCKILCLWSTIVVLLANACLERSVEI